MPKVEFDYSKLRGKIIEKYGTLSKFADVLGISLTSLSQKLNNMIAFSQDEIYLAMLLLELDNDSSYFFTRIV